MVRSVWVFKILFVAWVLDFASVKRVKDQTRKGAVGVRHKLFVTRPSGTECPFELSVGGWLTCFVAPNPGILIVYVPGKSPKSHIGFWMTLCTWQHERGALFITIMTYSEETLSEERFLALETLHKSEGSAWLGRALRQMGTRARLDSNLSVVNRASVWTNSFTVAVQIQQEAIAKTGSLRSEGLFRLLETVVQGDASSRERQYA